MADDREHHRLGAAAHARALARGAVVKERLGVARAHALTRHFEHAKLRDRADPRACAVVLQVVAETILDVAAVLQVAHVDEVVDDHAPEVA